MPIDQDRVYSDLTEIGNQAQLDRGEIGPAISVGFDKGLLVEL